tara:strand:- start:4110 stop:4517 length:408 start_codon:yes stop_codon:yes gene_type:complete
MSIVYDDIRAALEVALAAIPNLPPIAWENKSFTPDTAVGYIQVRQLPTARRPTVRGLNPQQRYQGVFQLLVKMPENKGPNPAQTVVTALINAFEATTDLSYDATFVTIDYTEQVGGFTDSPFYTIPVNVNWYSYK